MISKAAGQAISRGINDTTKIAKTITGIASAVHGARMQEEQLDLAMKKFIEDKRRFGVNNAFRNLQADRNFDMQQKRLIAQLAQQDQATRQNTLNRMQSAYQFAQTKEGQENQDRVGRAFTSGILNAISHTKKG